VKSVIAISAAACAFTFQVAAALFGLPTTLTVPPYCLLQIDLGVRDPPLTIAARFSNRRRGRTGQQHGSTSECKKFPAHRIFSCMFLSRGIPRTM
jgi:hypothetical protein